MTDGVAGGQGDGDEGVGKAATEPSAPWRLWRLHGNRLNGWQYVLDPSLKRAHLNGSHGIPPDFARMRNDRPGDRLGQRLTVVPAHGRAAVGFPTPIR